MIRFIHAADIHLDSPMRGIDSEAAGIDAAVYRSSTREALKNLVDYAIRQDVHFITLGGDNYDGDWDGYGTGRFFLDQMSRLDKIKVVSITGNHDAQNRMTYSLSYPDNFHMLNVENPEVFEVMDGVRIVGQGFKEKEELRNLAEGYPRLEGGGVKIGLLHTSLDGRATEHRTYAPCNVDDLKRKHYHFWGLGHIHKQGWMNQSGDAPILFPGNLQGRHSKETGPKGAYLIELNDDGSLHSEHFEAMDVSRWEEVEIDTSKLTQIDELWNECKSTLKKVYQDVNPRQLAVRVVMKGQTEIHQKLIGLKEFGGNKLLQEMQQQATYAARGKIWVEKVELKTSPNAGAIQVQVPDFLTSFLNKECIQEEWIQKFLQDQEALKKKITDVRNESEVSELMSLLEPDSIRELLREIPEYLEAELVQKFQNETI